MFHFAPHALAQFPMSELPPQGIPAAMSPLMLADRLITLAKDADRDGFVTTADHLVRLANAIWDRGATTNA
jgi:hypothetical protein